MGLLEFILVVKGREAGLTLDRRKGGARCRRVLGLGLVLLPDPCVLVLRLQSILLTVSLCIHAVAMTTDEVEKHQRDERQQAECDQESRRAGPEEDALQPGSRQPAGRGLSRLFSSLLRRRSQGGSHAGDNKDEEQSKAPIADPEPELRAEGELAPDQHSVSSADAQVSGHTAHTCRELWEE